MMAILRLALNSYSIEIGVPGVTPFSGNEYPRKPISLGGITRSINGTPILSGPAYETPHIWSFSALLDADNRALLDMMWADWDADRSQKFIIDDNIQPFIERSPRTRALAIGASPTFNGNLVVYHARFYAIPTVPFASSPKGRYTEVTATFEELEKLPA